MELVLKQQLKLTQQLVMTPQLQMAIKLLQLSRLELLDKISQEMEENPALEEVPIDALMQEKESAGKEKPEPDSDSIKEVTIKERLPDDVEWSNYLGEYSSFGKASFEFEKKETTDSEFFSVKGESLQQHLLWQLLMTFSLDEEKRIGSLIIGNLNSDGYLDCDLEEIVTVSGAPAAMVENTFKKMQTFDPIGVCARDVSECLLVQARYMGIEDILITNMIKYHLNHIENKNIKALCKNLGAKKDDIIAAVEVIRGLEPRPGRQFSEETPQYIIPDIHLNKFEGKYVIMLNDSGMPLLRVSNFYKQKIAESVKLTDIERDYIQDKIRSATWLVRSIHQRQKTIYKVMESILKFQYNFFEKGVSGLKPMVLKDVALDIGMHESTISRVTTNKYVHTPRGIFELKYFFNSSVNQVDGGAASSVSVKDKIRKIIKSEDNRKPRSDRKIATILRESNIKIARRTVAKYREMMKILPSSKRKVF